MEKNICSLTKCGTNGVCSAKYLGASLPVSIGQCVCADGLSGENCDTKTK